MRYSMRLDRIWLPVLAPFGGVLSRSYVEITDGAVRFRFGWSFDETMPRSEIAGAEPIPWPLPAGVGWRIWGGTVGLIGSRQGVVAVRLRAPRRVRLLFIPWRCRRIAVSLEDPDAFLQAIGSRE